jgi:putative radical SAM enzyme (TIGR03279 family)
MKGLKVVEVLPGSIAAEMEIEAGDTITAVNGSSVRDIVDYQFFADSPNLVLDLIKNNGEYWEVELERGEGESIGLIFSPPEPRRCDNRCVFCFVSQLPKGLRSPLYVKDEDFLLSFLCGNYVTLSSITKDELLRIKEQRLSPLYISVHSTDPLLRDKLLGRRRKSVPILDLLQELASYKITMHTQVVLCPHLNDGEALERTVADLAALYPFVASLAIVPVGLTRHRKGLPELEPVTPDYAASFLDNWLPYAQKLNKRLGSAFLMFADEFFIKAGRLFPQISSYGDLVQLENGVGMIPLFLKEGNKVLKKAKKCCPIRVTVVTGKSPYAYLKDFLDKLAIKTGVEFQVVPVENRLFGSEVTVTGLVSGRDIVAALHGHDIGGILIVPDVMLKEGEGVFLDDMTIESLQEAVKTRVEVVESTPTGIYELISM